MLFTGESSKFGGFPAIQPSPSPMFPEKSRGDHNDDEQADGQQHCHLFLDLMEVFRGEHAQGDFLSREALTLAVPSNNSFSTYQMLSVWNHLLHFPKHGTVL